MSVNIGTIASSNGKRSSLIFNNLHDYWNFNHVSENYTSSYLNKPFLNIGGPVKSSSLSINSEYYLRETSAHFSASQLSHLSGSPINLSSTLYDFSICGWFNTAETTSLQTLIGQWGDGAGQGSFLIYMDGINLGKIQFAIKGTDSTYPYSETTYTLYSTNRTLPNNWYFVSATYNNTNKIMSLYVNSSSADTISTDININGILYSTDTPLYFGRDHMDRYFTGSMSSFGIWRRELSSQEILYLYNSGSGRSYTNNALI